jgi:hypothetical protein
MSHTISRTRFRLGAIALLVVGIAVASAGCGSGDKSAVCSSRDDLRSSVDALLKVNPGTDSLDDARSKLTDVRDSTADLASAAGTQYKPQVDALQASTKSLTDTLKKLGTSPSTAGLSSLPGEISAVRTDTNALLDAVSSACD